MAEQILNTADILALLSQRWMTTIEIAKKLGLKDSRKVRSLLKQLEDQGIIESNSTGRDSRWRIHKRDVKKIQKLKKMSKGDQVESISEKELQRRLITLGVDLYKTMEQGNFPQIKIPSRSTSNIQFDPELRHYVLGDTFSTRSVGNIKQIRAISQQIWVMRFIKTLLETDKSSTLRDVYYQSFGFDVRFETQGESDSIITDTEAVLQVPRETFKVFPEERSAIFGDLEIEYTSPKKYTGKRVNIQTNPDGFMIGPHVVDSKFIRTSADKIIAVECLSPNSLIQLADGNILKIEELEPETILTANFPNHKFERAKAIAIVQRPRREYEQLLKIRTGGMYLEATPSHHLFVLTENGVIKKPIRDLKIGDWIIEARIIDVSTNTQRLSKINVPQFCRINKDGCKKIKAKRELLKLSQRKVAVLVCSSQGNIGRIERMEQRPELELLNRLLEVLEIDLKKFCKEHVKVEKIAKPISVPSSLTPALAEFFGYLLGDGHCSESGHYWIDLTDKNRKLLNYYKKLGKSLFNLDSKIVNYDRQRLIFYSAPLRRYILENFPELLTKSIDRDIPSQILKSPKSVTLKFIRGLFDAEGYVSNDIAIGMSASQVVRKLQLLLLRHNINSHLTVNPANRSTNYNYRLQISDFESIKRFKSEIGFNHPEKKNKLNTLFRKKAKQRRLPNRSPYPPLVKKMIRSKFKAKRKAIPSKFYGDSGGVTKEALKEAIDFLGYDPDLAILQRSEFMWSKIRSIKKAKKQPIGLWDISVPEGGNFIANGIVVSNSGGMFTRFVEEDVSNRFKSLLVHTAGQAPRSTRRLLRRLGAKYNLPLYIFTDGDPWGVHIAMVIISGSAQAAHIRGLASPDATWIGVWASDIIDYKLPSFAMTQTDLKRTEELLKDPRYQSAFWQMQLQTFLKIRKKAEQQAFSKYSLDYVVDEYLPKKFDQIKQLKRKGIL